MIRERLVYLEVFNGKYGPVADRVAQCWLNHAPVSSDQEHMLLDCDEAVRLRKLQALRELLRPASHRSLDQRSERETPMRRPARQVPPQPGEARSGVASRGMDLVQGPVRQPVDARPVWERDAV